MFGHSDVQTKRNETRTRVCNFDTLRPKVWARKRRIWIEIQSGFWLTSAFPISNCRADLKTTTINSRSMQPYLLLVGYIDGNYILGSGFRASSLCRTWCQASVLPLVEYVYLSKNVSIFFSSYSSFILQHVPRILKDSLNSWHADW